MYKYVCIGKYVLKQVLTESCHIQFVAKDSIAYFDHGVKISILKKNQQTFFIEVKAMSVISSVIFYI